MTTRGIPECIAIDPRSHFTVVVCRAIDENAGNLFLSEKIYARIHVESFKSVLFERINNFVML